MSGWTKSFQGLILHGHRSFPFSITPWPSGPPRCRQTLSIAVIVPFTFAMQIILSPQGNSLASFLGGSSDSLVSLVNIALGRWPWHCLLDGNEQESLVSQKPAASSYFGC